MIWLKSIIAQKETARKMQAVPSPDAAAPHTGDHSMMS